MRIDCVTLFGVCGLRPAVADAFWCTWHDSKKAKLAPPLILGPDYDLK